jgi:hypothetical protein
MVIQAMDFIMIRHVATMFSLETMPSSCKVACHWMPSMTLRLVPLCVKNWHKYPKICPS